MADHDDNQKIKESRITMTLGFRPSEQLRSRLDDIDQQASYDDQERELAEILKAECGLDLDKLHVVSLSGHDVTLTPRPDVDMDQVRRTTDIQSVAQMLERLMQQYGGTSKATH